MPHIGLDNDLRGIVGSARFGPETGGRPVRWPRPCSGTHAPRCLPGPNAAMLEIRADHAGGPRRCPASFTTNGW